MNTDLYYKVKIAGIDSEEQESEIKIIAQKFCTVGVLDLQMDESEVDALLGVDAFCGGDIPEHLLAKVDRNVSDISVFFAEETNATSFISVLRDEFNGLSINGSEHNIEDWNARWKEHYSIIEVAENLLVIPSWVEEIPSKHKDSMKIFINPGMGFGTGDHETTFLCLEVFNKIRPELTGLKSLLDFGCGSGILGILAMKWDIENCDFVDIDKAALKNCITNIDLNFKDIRLDNHGVYSRENYGVKEYDFVFANILEVVLISEIECLTNSVKAGGRILVSGILHDQEESIKIQYEKYGIAFDSIFRKGEWSAMLGVKK